MSTVDARIDIHEIDDSVLAVAAATDIDAFAELYRRYQCDVFRFVRRVTPDEATAEDLTAQVFFRALRSASTYDGSGSYAAWLFQIARNSIATWHRTRARDVAVEDVPEEVDPSPSAVTRVIDDESRGQMWSVVARLPFAQREAVELRYLHDLSIEEISEATDRKPGAVRALLHSARARLRKYYGGDA